MRVNWGSRNEGGALDYPGGPQGTTGRQEVSLRDGREAPGSEGHVLLPSRPQSVDSIRACPDFHPDPEPQRTADSSLPIIIHTLRHRRFSLTHANAA